MIGYGAIVLALISSLFAAVCFFMGVYRKDGKHGMPTAAQRLYILSAGLIGVAALYLLYILLGNRFDYAYVFGYSSRDLPLVYKVSAFWAGQEGSFMLWLVFHAIFGFFLLRKSGENMPAMGVFSVFQTILLFLLLVKSPFMMLAEHPIDGVGLNPLLQDPWMVIHPPILFLGYAALAVPFSYGLAGMLKNCHQEWLADALAWTLFASACLGAGMFIGGFWAYKVLGWGGYWAWDPVENSSLVPWLAAAAVIHLLVLAKARDGAVKPAYAGVIMSFVLVLYGTFLTRSGVLSDFSTHSFADEGLAGFLGLTVLLSAFAAFTIFIIKWPGLPSGELYSNLASREFILALTALILSFFAVLVFVGMSTPLVSTAFGSPKSVSSVFYNNATLPLAAAIGGALIAGPLLKWGNVACDYRGQNKWIALLLAGGLLFAVLLNIKQPLVIIVLSLAPAAAVINIYAGYTNRLSWSAACSHIGVAFMLTGILVSGAAGQSATVTFVQGQPQDIFGCEITYAGTENDSSGKGVFNTFQIGNNNIASVQSLTKFGKTGEPAAREPGIYRSLFTDIYISPIVKEESQTELLLLKGRPIEQDGVTLNFIKFNMTGMDTGPEVRVQAVIEVTAGAQTQQVQPELSSKNGRITGSTVTALERYQLHITSLRPGEGQVTIEFKDTKSINADSRLDAEISTKPLINLVWLGACLITAGTGWAGLKKLIRSQSVLQRGQCPAARTASRTR